MDRNNGKIEEDGNHRGMKEKKKRGPIQVHDIPRSLGSSIYDVKPSRNLPFYPELTGK